MEGHYGLNALLYAPVAFLLATFATIELAAFGAIIMVGCARLPDRDGHFDSGLEGYRGNWILHRVPIKHRGIMHTVWFGLFVVGVCTGMLGYFIAISDYNNATFAIVGYAVGAFAVCGHLLGDAMTKSGIEPFQPISHYELCWGWFNSGNAIINKCVLGIGMISLLVAFQLSIEAGDIQFLDEVRSLQEQWIVTKR